MMMALYVVIGFIVFGLSLFTTITGANIIGFGDDIGTLLTGIALLKAIVIVCTMVILDAIKGTKMKK